MIKTSSHLKIHLISFREFELDFLLYPVMKSHKTKRQPLIYLEEKMGE